MLHALVAENCNNPGTSTFSLAGALPGCVAFSVRFTDGQPVFYLATDGASPPNYEAGIGTFHATTVPATISRDTVTENSAKTTAKISFPGAIQVINFLASDKAVYVDNAGNAHINGNAVVSGDAYVNGNLRMNTNGMSLFAQDTGNVTRQVFIPLDSGNNTDIFIAGGASSPQGKFQVINQANTTPLFTVDNLGNAAIHLSLTMGGGILLNNNTAILAKDASAAAQNMIFIDASNNLDVQVPNASSAFRVLNHAGTVSLFQVDNSGNATLTGTLHVTGAANFDGTVTILNNAAYYGKDTSGVAHPLMLMDNANLLTMWIPLAQRFRVVNTAFSAELFSVDNSGNCVVASALTVGTSVSAATISAATISATSLIHSAGNVSLDGWQFIGGTTSGTIFGYELFAGGTQALSGTARSISLSCPNGAVSAVTIDAISDIRIKSDIQAIRPIDGEAFVRSAKPSTYMLNDHKQSGFVAQDIIRAGYHHMVSSQASPGLPELVEGDLTSRADILLTFSYNDTIPYITAALQGALARLDAIEKT